MLQKKVDPANDPQADAFMAKFNAMLSRFAPSNANQRAITACFYPPINTTVTSSGARWLDDHNYSIPINEASGHIGTLHLRFELPPSQKALQEILDFVDCTARPYFAGRKTLDGFNSAEFSLGRLLKKDRYAEDIPQEPTTTLEETVVNANTPQRSLLISSENEYESFKAALAFHESSGRHIFLPFSDLTEEARHNSLELIEMQETTLYVANWVALSDTEKQTLTRCLHQLSLPTHSLGIVIACDCCSDDLLREEWVELCDYRMNLDRSSKITPTLTNSDWFQSIDMDLPQ